MHLGDMPKLVDLTMSLSFKKQSYTFHLFSRYYHRLESFKEEIDCLIAKANEGFLCYLLRPNLKHLTLTIIANDDDSFLGWASMIKACPLLQKFTAVVIRSWDSPGRTRKVMKATPSPHQNLKVVEFCGWAEKKNLISTSPHTYLIETSTKLEKLVIDLQDLPGENMEVQGTYPYVETQAARLCAMQSEC